MSKLIGIDLGTTHSLAAVVDSGIPMVLADEEGSRMTPSIVHYPQSAGAPLVGRPAKRMLTAAPQSTIASVKRFMGMSALDLPALTVDSSVEWIQGPGNSIKANLPGGPLSPEEISSDILRRVKAVAEFRLEEKVDRAVITVPAYFNDNQRSATKKAGELAGLNVERILNEPTAAALAYGLNALREKSRIAVFDLGGGTFDLSILELHDGVFQVLSTHGNTKLGGDDVDAALRDYLAREIKKDAGPDVRGNPALWARLKESAEAWKIQLSDNEEIEISLPFLKDDYSFQSVLNRETLEALARPILLKTREHCLRALADARLTSEDLDQVILVGGQTRMPLVRRLAAEFFQCAEFEESRGSLRLGQQYHTPKGPMLNTSQNPDEAVALGAAIQAEILSGGFQNMLLLDVTPLSLGVETFGGLMNVLIPRNSTIPTKAGETFTTAMDYQKNMLIHVLQGEREKAADNWSLGRFVVDFEPAPKGKARVGVQFSIDANGILTVLARDIQTGKDTVVELKSAVDVDDAKVQRMVESSVEHAFDDLESRRWIETRIRAEETLNATRAAMESFGDRLDKDESGVIQTAAEKLEAVMGRENPETKTGDLNALQTALSELDNLTRPLAERMMEEVAEEMLQRGGLIGGSSAEDRAD